LRSPWSFTKVVQRRDSKFINAVKRQGAANGLSPQLVKVLMLNKTDRILKNARRSQWNLNKISQRYDFHQYR